MRPSSSATLCWAGILSVAVGLGIGSAQAQPAGDQDFVARAAMSNMVAIQLGHLATKKAQNGDVKQFAQTTIDDHLKAQQQLADAAHGAGVRWPKKLDESYQLIQQRLSKLSNDQFDREFMKVMIDRDRDIEQMLAARVSKGSGEDSARKKAAGATSDEPTLAAKVNQWATSTLSEVRAHLKAAEQVLGRLDQA
jgi:predicted outer membrane protein